MIYDFNEFRLLILVGTFVGILYRQALEFVDSLNLPFKFLFIEFWHQRLPPESDWCQNQAMFGHRRRIPESSQYSRCNDPGKSASHISTITPKMTSQFGTFLESLIKSNFT